MENQNKADEKLRELVREKINNKLMVLIALIDADITWDDNFWKSKAKDLIKANLEK